MDFFEGDIEKLTIDNEFFRKVIFTGKFTQLVLMNLKAGEEIGNEVHGVDQFFRFEEGQGKVIINGIELEVKDGSAVVVPAGSEHNVINTSHTQNLKLYTLYSPPQHADGTVHKTKLDADESEH